MNVRLEMKCKNKDIILIKKKPTKPNKTPNRRRNQNPNKQK